MRLFATPDVCRLSTSGVKTYSPFNQLPKACQIEAPAVEVTQLVPFQVCPEEQAETQLVPFQDVPAAQVV